MKRRCERAAADGGATSFGEYFVTSGRETLGTVELVGGLYRAVDVDGREVGCFPLLSQAVAALPERVVP
jgi:hypothetical protein